MNTKGRTLNKPLVVKDIITGMELAGGKLEGYLQSKLLSQRGCDIVSDIDEAGDQEQERQFDLEWYDREGNRV